MGDYGVGLQSLSPVDFNRLVNNRSLFSPENSPKTVLDEISEKSAATARHQQCSPSAYHMSDQKDSTMKNGYLDAASFDERHMDRVIFSPSSPFETHYVTSAAGSPGLWVRPLVAEDSYQGPFQNVNESVSFQKFDPDTMINDGNLIQNHAADVSMLSNSQSIGQRRAITAQHNFSHRPLQQGNGMILNNARNYPHWNNAHTQTHGTLSPWTQTQIHQQNRRSVPNMNISAFAQLKNIKAIFPQAQSQQSLSVIAPSKFCKSTSFPSQIHQATFAKPRNGFVGFDERQRENYLTSQDMGSSSYDYMEFTNFENQLLEIMKSTNMADQVDNMKGKRSIMFGEDTSNMLSEEGTLDQTVPNFGSPVNTSPGIEHTEKFSRKVFVGGLPPDIDEDEITLAFHKFGPVVVDWPHKAESKSYFPPKGYSFLLFQKEMSVQSLIEACIVDEDKLYWCVSSPTMKNKPVLLNNDEHIYGTKSDNGCRMLMNLCGLRIKVQIRPWNLCDSDFVMDGSQPLDPRKTIFVGGVPRTLRSVELAVIMDRLYGGVCYAGIDTDPELKYPKGAGRVAFSNQQSYIAAISARFVQLQHGDNNKRVEVKPYVLDDQMCDECQGARCGGKFASFFCANVTCLQYYCEHCWAQIHSKPGREFHKPLVKEGADRPRAVPFRWC